MCLKKSGIIEFQEFQAEFFNASFVTEWHYMPGFSSKK